MKWSILFPAYLAYISAAMGASILLPKPAGPFNTSVTTAQLIDTTRIDPFSPTQQLRAVMISVFYPINLCSCSPTGAAYAPPFTAAFEDQEFAPFGVVNGSFDSLQLQVCNVSGLHPQDTNQLRETPILLFSGALGTTRLFYNLIAQSVASAGYVVVTVDHPYDADIVEFPDGSSILAANISSDAQLELDVQTRAQDVRFVLDSLSNASFVQQLIPSFHHRLSTKHVGMFGHSLGGATVAAVMANDSRIVGGVNLDGSFVGAAALQRPLDRPFLLVGHEGKNQTSDDTWGAIWPFLTGFRLELALLGSQHYAFSDLPLVGDTLGLRNGSDAGPIDGLLGTIAGPRALDVVRTYVVAFFDMVFYGRNEQLLKRPSKQFPEVVFIAS